MRSVQRFLPPESKPGVTCIDNDSGFTCKSSSIPSHTATDGGRFLVPTEVDSDDDDLLRTDSELEQTTYRIELMALEMGPNVFGHQSRSRTVSAGRHRFHAI